MKAKIFLFFLISLFFVSCQKQKNGTITEMWYEPDRTYMTFMPITISTGKSVSTILVPFFIHDNEDWCIKVNGVTEKGDTIDRIYYIPKEAYDTLIVGKFICIDGNCDDEDNNNIKERK